MACSILLMLPDAADEERWVDAEEGDEVTASEEVLRAVEAWRDERAEKSLQEILRERGLKIQMRA